MSIKTTKQEMREVIRGMVADARKSGVPDDGLAEMLLHWVLGHLKTKTEVIDG